MLDELKSLLGQIPKIESRITKLENKKPEEPNYEICENCGNLVHKNYAQNIAVLEKDYKPSSKEFKIFNPLSFYELIGGALTIGSAEENTKANTIYFCNHCDIKKFKKTNKIK